MRENIIVLGSEKTIFFQLITADTERSTLRNEISKLQQEIKFGAEQMQRKTDEYQSTLDDLAHAHRVSEDGRLNALQELGMSQN